jgi:hypothetical protein
VSLAQPPRAGRAAQRADVWLPLLTVFCLLASAALRTEAQTSSDATAREPRLPPGLAALWRVDGRKLDARDSAWSIAAFSNDGELVGISDDSGTRIYRADDGRLVRVLPPPFSTGQFAYSLAISASGLVAIGRVGGVEVYPLHGAAGPAKYHCGGSCGPVSAAAFSLDGKWLAFQAARGALEPTPGLVSVVDLAARKEVVTLEASATRTNVAFAADGRALFAANVTRVDESGTFGLRSWVTAGWRRGRDLPGAPLPKGAVGPYALNESVAAYQRDGQLELRALASGAVVWAVPLAPAAFDAASDSGAMQLDLVAFAPDFVLSFESPEARDEQGAIVLRRMADGETMAMYDVAAVSALAVAPNGGTFVYSTGAGRTYTVLARVPR